MAYETPEVLTVGEATDLILGSGFSGNDCCTCGRKSSTDGGYTELFESEE